MGTNFSPPPDGQCDNVAQGNAYVACKMNNWTKGGVDDHPPTCKY